MKKIIYIAFFIGICLNLHIKPADITSPAKKIHLEEQPQKIAKKIIPALTKLCIEKLYPYVKLETLVPEILETFDLNLRLETEFKNMPLKEQTKVICGLTCSTNVDFGNIEITLDQLNIEGCRISSELPVLHQFYKKIVAGFVAKNPLMRQWVKAYTDLLLNSSPETLDSNIQTFETLPQHLQEYIKEELFFSQPITFQRNAASSGAEFDASYTNYVLLKGPYILQILSSRNLRHVTQIQMPPLGYHIFNNVLYYVSNNQIKAFDLLHKREHEKHFKPARVSGMIYYKHTTDNSIHFTAHQEPDKKHTLCCWDLTTHTCTQTITDFTDKILAIQPEGKQLYVATANGKIHCVDLASGKQLKTFEIPRQKLLKALWLKCMLFTYNNHLYMRINDTLCIWDIPSAKPLEIRIELFNDLKRKNNLLYILWNDAFRVWDMDDKNFVQSISLNQPYSTCEVKNGFIYLMDSQQQTTMILDQDTWAPVKTNQYEILPNRLHRAITYKGRIFEAFIHKKTTPTYDLNPADDLNLYIRDPLTENRSWKWRMHTSKIIDIASNHNYIYSLDEQLFITQCFHEFASWKVVICRHMISHAKNMQDLQRVKLLMNKSNFGTAMSAQEKEDTETLINIKAKYLATHAAQPQDATA